VCVRVCGCVCVRVGGCVVCVCVRVCVLFTYFLITLSVTSDLLTEQYVCLQPKFQGAAAPLPPLFPPLW